MDENQVAIKTYPIMKGEIDMFNKQLKQNIKAIDERIAVLMEELDNDESGEQTIFISMKLERLIEMRDKLSQNKVNESNSKEIISGALGIGASLVGIVGLKMVLKYEETDVVTSKAFSMLPKLFRG